MNTGKNLYVDMDFSCPVIGMEWKKSPEKLVKFINERMAQEKCEPRKMFGYPCYFINGNMFIGLHQDNLVLRLGEDDRKTAMKKDKDVKVFEPMPGRKMGEYIVIPATIYSNKAAFDALLAKSMKYVSSLPPKQKKSKKKSK